MQKTTRPRRGPERRPPAAGGAEPAARGAQPRNGHAARPPFGVVPGGRAGRTDENGQPLGPPVKRQLRGPSHHWLVDDGRGGARPQERQRC